MKNYTAENIRNIAMVGHAGAGKTSVAESMLYLTKATDRFGKVNDGNTVCDFDPEEIKRKASIFTAVAPIEYKDTKINLIDTPGLFDFEGGIYEGMRAAETALIIVSGKDGVCVGTEKAYKIADKEGLTKMFFVNALCDEGSRFYDVFDALKDTFGAGVCPLVVPYVADGKAEIYINLLENKAYEFTTGEARETAMPDLGGRLADLKAAMNEAVAEASEELMNKFFDGEEFTQEEIISGIKTGVKDGSIHPVFCGDALNIYGIGQLLKGIVWLAPSPAEKASESAKDDAGNDIEVEIKEDGPTAAIVFKTVADPFVGKLSYFKVISGKITPDSQLINTRTGATERVAKVMIIKGKKQEEAKYIGAGDIGCVAKLQGTVTGDTLCNASKKVVLKGVTYPASPFTMAISPANKGEEDKVAQGLARIAEEDPTISFYTNTETKQMVISGLGEQHLDVVVSKLKTKFGTSVLLSKPKVAYRETIRKKVQVQGRHKKQSGGHGQFGDVWIEFEPCNCDGLEFAERVVGGSVPKGFFPAVEKGLLESIQKGPLAGYPVVGLRATLYDGSYHPVDSSEMSFKMAASIAYKNGMPMANPTLLEPIGTLRATVPDSNMGDVMGEVNKRRGRVLGMNPGEDDMQIVEAEVPMAEMYDFNTFIRQITQGRGSFTFEFERYEDAPANVAQKVIEESKAE
ncbi:MAG: elongation factor G [Clostridia bacterium]|nr:elongation factor G [Clostridia bacterium]